MNNTQYINYLFNHIKKITFGNPGVIRQTYGRGENLTHKFLERQKNVVLKIVFVQVQFGAQTPNFRRREIVCSSPAFEKFYLDCQFLSNFEVLFSILLSIP